MFKIGLILGMKRLSRMSRSVSEVPDERILNKETFAIKNLFLYYVLYESHLLGFNTYI